MTYIHALGAPDPDEDNMQPILPCPASNRPCVICDPTEPISRYEAIEAVNTPGAHYIDGDGEEWIVGENGADVPAYEDFGPVTNADGTPTDLTREMLAGTGRDPDAFAREAFLKGAPIGSPERPAMIGGVPFVARDEPLTLAVGTRVTNQDSDYPLTGIVIVTPEGQAEPDGWVWVSWSNGLVCEEYLPDITATLPAEPELPADRPTCGPGCSHLTQAEHAAERRKPCMHFEAICSRGADCDNARDGRIF